MNGRSVTDAQISQALRAHLPERAQPGLRARVLDATRTTSQQRPLPLFLGALSDADPVGRRRSLLVAAALLAALAVASATAVGAWRLIQQDSVDKLSLDPPADVPAFVLSSYERLPQLPPVALTWRDSDSTKGRIYVDRSGAVRFDRFMSADATEPSSFTLLSGNTLSGVATVGSDKVWVEPDEPNIGEDPRVFLRSILRPAGGGPGCEMERDPSEVSNGSAAAGWRYVGLDYVAGRPTHHVACAGDLWIDIETRLILRTQGPAVDDAGQPIPVKSTEVTEIAFGEQPAELFQPPEGLARMSMEEYKGYICARDLPNEILPGISDCPTAEAEATPPPESSPTPTPTAPPGPSDCAVSSSAPSEPIGPLAWTSESLKEAWPAPVRPEPAGGGSVQPMPLTYLDPTGDNGSDAYPCVDIRGVMADTNKVHLKLDSSQPAVDPAEQWIAYGVVTDEDRDGVPDWRYGIDNIPFATAEASSDPSPMRWWRTDLHTDQTKAGGMGGGDADWYGADFRSAYPSGRADATFLFGGSDETIQGSVPWGLELDMPFYTWASVIVNGRVVATDYAPDSGWLVATRGATPGGTVLLGDPYPDLSMTVPDGWRSDATGGDGTAGAYAGGLSRVACADEPDGQADRCARVRFAVIDNPEDLCSDTIKPPLGPSFDDLVTYVAGLPTIKVSENADVTVDGFRGKHLRYTMDGAVSELDLHCDFAGISISAYDDVWILDVDGIHLLIASDVDQAEIRQMVESIHFER